jgi:tetratricopeptide (TPR) repeat protein
VEFLDTSDYNLKNSPKRARALDVEEWNDVSTNPSRVPSLLTLYEQYLDRQDAAEFAAEVSKCYTPGTLERLARHAEHNIRRAAILALGFVGNYDSNHTVGRALTDDDRTVRTIAENTIRTLWGRVGTESERQELAVIARYNAAQLHKEAIERATSLVERTPWFAEAWYQRAVAHFALGQSVEAIRDCHETLEINPYHFIASTTMGQAYLELQNFVSALECFRRALRLNPDLEGVRVQVVRLTRSLEGNR